MLSSDKPISTREEDFLNRKVFAQNISKAIESYEKNSDSLTIGLYGKWGSGKTSIVNMIVEALETNNDIIVFKFEPWIYSDTEQLISHFFREFAKVVKHKDYAKEFLRIGEELETYASFFEPMSMIPEPTVSFLSLASSKVMKSVGRASKKLGKLKTKSLSSTKEAIEKHLSKIDKKILIVIDDIDRLNSTEIRQIFQMIKVLGNFPNTIYLSVMERDVVVDALSEVQKGDGSDYLEKIIHVPFEVPAIPREEVWKFLESSIQELFVVTLEADKIYLRDIFRRGFKYFFNNIRDVKRYMNVLRFNYNALGKELNDTDLMAITALQVFEPQVYDDIRTNKDIFVGYIPEHERYSAKKVLEDIFATFSYISQKKGKKFIETIFPEIVTILGGTESVGFSSGYRKEARVCSEDFFDSYFQMTLNDNEIFNSDMKKYIEKASSEKEFRSLILRLIDNGKITRFLERLEDFTEHDISTEKFPIIFDVLMDLGDQFPSEETMMFPDNKKVEKILYKLLHRLKNKDDRFVLFEQAIQKCTNSIWIACDNVNTQRQEHGEIDEGGAKPEHQQTLTIQQLRQLQKTLQVKIEEWVEKNKLFEHQYSRNILRLWNKLNPEKAEKYKLEQLNDNEQVLRILEKFINISYSRSNTDYVSNISKIFTYDELKEFIDVEKIVKQVKELDKNFDKYQTTDRSRFVIDEFLKYYHDELKEQADEKSKENNS